MSHASRPRLRGLCLIATLFALLVAAPMAQAHNGPIFKTPKKNGVYLAMGDSLAFGYQQAKVLAGLPNPDPATFNTGYVDVFGAAITATYPTVTTTNLGCPGETSDTLLNATNATTGCTTYPFGIHENHPNQTQMRAALKVLRQNEDKVVPVTIGIGANDVLGLVRNTCTTAGVIDLGCVQANAPATFLTIQSNLDKALRKIRDEAERTEILVVGLYNPLYPAIFQQVLTQTGNPATAAAAAAGTDQLAAQLNSLMATTAAKYRAYFVDPLPLFNPQGDPNVELGTICTLTAVCGPLQDIHPTDAGYAALGNLVKQVSGY